MDYILRLTPLDPLTRCDIRVCLVQSKGKAQRNGDTLAVVAGTRSRN